MLLACDTMSNEAYAAASGTSTRQRLTDWARARRHDLRWIL